MIRMGQGFSESYFRDSVLALVRQVMKERRSDMTGEELAKTLELNVLSGALPDDQDGAYLDDTRTILINQNLGSFERRNFTCFHEITHHLVRSCEDLYSQLNEVYRENHDFDFAMERFCNIGAAEFLLPQQYVRELIDSKGFTIQHIEQLCNERQASGPAAAIQLAHCATHHCYVVVCELGIPPSNRNLRQTTFVNPISKEKLYILYAGWSPSSKYTVSRFTVIPSDHLLWSIHRDQQYFVGEDRIPFQSGTKWKVPCEAIYYGGKTYAVFNVTPSPNPNQAKLF